MTGVDKDCVTHHLACECREAAWLEAVEDAVLLARNSTRENISNEACVEWALRRGGLLTEGQASKL